MRLRVRAHVCVHACVCACMCGCVDEIILSVSVFLKVRDVAYVYSNSIITLLLEEYHMYVSPHLSGVMIIMIMLGQYSVIFCVSSENYHYLLALNAKIAN